MDPAHTTQSIARQLRPDVRALVLAVKRHLSGQPEGARINALLEAMLARLVAWHVSQMALCLAPLALVAQADGATAALRAAIPARLDQEELARLVARVAACLAGASARDTAQRRVEWLRRLFMLAYDEPEAALIVLAEHMAGEPDEHHLFVPKQPWVDSTNEVFLPMLEMLGIWELRMRLGNRALQLGDAEQYDRYEAHITSRQREQLKDYDALERRLVRAFDESGMHAECALHRSEPLRLHYLEELARRRDPQAHFNPESDRMRVDIQVDKRLDCYTALGVIRELGRAFTQHSGRDNQFRDFVATPRFNGYRRLVTAVQLDDLPGPRARVVEFRVCTPEMHAINNRGFVATLELKRQPELPQVWWQDDELRHYVRESLVGDVPERVYVFSPIGEVRILPRKSTPVDFAFQVHSNMGINAKRFFVNGEETSYDAHLRNGDLVSIELDELYPSVDPSWRDCAATSHARKHIRQYLAREKRNPERGRERINQVLRRELDVYELRFTDQEIERALEEIASQMRCDNVAILCARVAEGALQPDQVVARVIERKLTQRIVRADGTPIKEPIRLDQSWINLSRAQGKLDAASRIVPGAPIVGRFAGRDRHTQLMVYRADSPNAPTDLKAVQLRWRQAMSSREYIEIEITAHDRPHLLDQILHAVYELYGPAGSGLYLHRVDAEALGDGSAQIKLVVGVSALADVRPAIEHLEQFKREGLIHALRQWQYSPGVRRQLILEQDAANWHPYQLSEVRNELMFFGRQSEIAQCVGYLRQGANVVLSGPRRIGKTSFLLHLRDHVLRDLNDMLPVYIDAQEMSQLTPDHILRSAAKACQAALLVAYGKKRLGGLSISKRDFHRDPYEAFAEWAIAARKVVGNRRLVLMVDEFTALERGLQNGQLEASFFERMRAIATRFDHIQWLICVHAWVYQAGIDRKPEGRRHLFEAAHHISLARLDPEAIEGLLRQPIQRLFEYDEAAVTRAIQLTGSHPYYAHIFSSELVDHMRQQRRQRIALEDVNVVSDLIAGTSFYFNILFDNLSQQQKAALNALAFASEAQSPWVAPKEIEHWLRELGQLGPAVPVRTILTALASRDLVEWQEIGNSIRYRIRVGLFESWLRRHPLDVGAPTEQGVAAQGHEDHPW